MYDFLVSLQVDIVPKGCAGSARHPPPSREWKLYWKQRVVDSPDFDVLGWRERACNHMGLATLGVALNSITHPLTATVAEGSVSIMTGLLTPDWCFMSHASQIGYLLADVNKRFPTWALQPQTMFVGNNLSLLACELAQGGPSHCPRRNAPPEGL